MASRSSPPRLPPEVLETQAGYHRLFLTLSLALLCVCFLLPAPNKKGQIYLSFLNVPAPSFCMLQREFGIDCPGCGLTRCFLAMSHAQLRAAWGYHPVGVLLFAALAVQIPYRSYQLWRIRLGHPGLTHWTLRVLPWLLVAAILGQWMLRTTGILSP